MKGAKKKKKKKITHILPQLLYKQRCKRRLVSPTPYILPTFDTSVCVKKISDK